MSQPMPVAICALIHKNKILLIQRIRGEYVGLWGLPGGKIEKHEFMSGAAIREILEETGIDSEFKSFYGLISEHLKEDNKITEHFLLHLCELEPKTTEIKNNQAGEARWFDLKNLEQHREKIIPSDFLMIQNMVKNKESNYYNCVLVKKNNKYILERFEPVD